MKKWKINMDDIFDVIEVTLLSWICFILFKIMFDFGNAMEAWTELTNAIRGY